MSALAAEIRHVRRELARLHRKAALARMPVKVDQVRDQDGDWQVRVEIGRDPASDQKVLSPWVRVQPASAGELKIKVKPTVGEQMYLLSTSGVVGADSLAIWGAFDDEHKPPPADDDLVIERGTSRIALKDGRITLKVGGSEVEIVDSTVNVVAGAIIAAGKTYLGMDQKGETVDVKVVTDAGPAKKTFAKPE